jgi:ElaA protein
MLLNWQLKKFDTLTASELYAIMQLRNEVFVVEQNCLYQDADDKDQPSWHLMGTNSEHQLMAYSRLLPAGVAFKEPSIGRVVTHADVRREGAGKELMNEAIKCCNVLFNNAAIRIGAQLYLLQFYRSFGFKQVSEIYLEDGIEHIEMILISEIKE